MVDTKKYEWINVPFETPKGWDGFLNDMCIEINDYLERHNLVEKYTLLQVKEKFGVLMWYDNGLIPNYIIDKYEKLSTETCAICGEKAEHMTKGYIMYLCDKCYNEWWLRRNRR